LLLFYCPLFLLVIPAKCFITAKLVKQESSVFAVVCL